MDFLMEMRDVSVGFGGKMVIHDVCMKLEPGEVSCLMGPSGCGKTTTLRLVAGLIKPLSGEIRLLGKTIDFETDESELVETRRELGVVFQGGALFDSMSVGQNIAFPLRYCRNMTDESKISSMVLNMLDNVELGDLRDKYPSELSGGMRKRVSIARSLVHSPALLLLDEPTTGLDPMTARHIDQLILSLCRKFGFSVLVVTHDLVSALGIAHHLLLMEDGRISWNGVPKEWVSSSHSGVRRFSEGMISVRRMGAGE